MNKISHEQTRKDTKNNLKIVRVLACLFVADFRLFAKPVRRVFLLFVVLGGGLFFGCFLTPSSSAQTDFSRFKHANATHSRLPCLVCHTRSDNSTTPKFMGHIPCASCHKEQFAEGNRSPLCTICHTATGVKRFPGLKSFGARFDHAKHVRQTNCASCHKAARGVGFSIPSGANAHASCFQCHTANAATALSSCGTCHQAGTPPRASEWAKAYTTTPFTHARHLQSMSCTSCHVVKAGAPRGRQVTSPLAAMHFAPRNTPSCAACHNNQRAFGGDDFKDCRRCHRGASFKF